MAIELGYNHRTVFYHKFSWTSMEDGLVYIALDDCFFELIGKLPEDEVIDIYCK